jgi:Mce-associated membrane protein
VLLAGLTGFLAWRVEATSGGGDVERARADALVASRQAARVVFSYDYRHLAKDFAAGKALITGQFAQEYARTTGKIVDDVAARYKAVVVADVSDAGVVRATSSTVVTLVFLNQESTSTLTSSSKITQSRLEMTMVHRHGRWLVSKIRAF